MNCCAPPPVQLRDVKYRGTVKRPITDEDSENDHGEIDYSDEANWETYLSGVWFAIATLRSTEPVVSDQQTGALTHALRTRHSVAKEAITPSMKIIVQRRGVERTYYVAGPPKLIHEDWLEIPGVEEVSG